VIKLYKACLYLLLPLLPAAAALSVASAPQTVPASHHLPEGRFGNPYVPNDSAGVLAFLKRRLFGGDEWPSYSAERDGPLPTATPRLVPANAASNNARVTWIGQATVLIQHAGVNVLTDPMFSERASPVSFAGPRRVSAPGLSFDELPPIDVVVVSHDHFDHLDLWSIRKLGNGPKYFVPLGLKTWLVDAGIHPGRIVELDWWQQAMTEALPVHIEVVATPAQHVSGRSFTDRNRRLWASWVIRWPDFSIWFGGDTGYNEHQFKAIGERFDGFDLAIIPIGSYAPREYMHNFHLDPEQAVQVHRDVRARQSMAVHWGTFDLTAEHLLEPPKLLDEALRVAGIAPEAFTPFAFGESRSYLPAYPPAELPAESAVLGAD
jgi:N-acyl-phosphatidylethanolamine-hydrolysing phospholipase D